MTTIYQNNMKATEEFGHLGDLVVGTNIAGFLKVADAIAAVHQMQGAFSGS